MVSNTPGNLLELFSSWKSRNLQSLLEMFWFSLRVCIFVVNISYSSCISECIGTKCLVVNEDQLILTLVSPGNSPIVWVNRMIMISGVSDAVWWISWKSYLLIC